MKTFKPADHLHSRTFIGLLIAQFLAAFNDQAIHASAMFFAINTATMSEAGAITLMPILFYLPWAIFCTIAGYLADRYSKRVALILWKVVEVGVTLFALLGFWMGRNGYPALGSYFVLSTVFLMGMHSAFFVPAKYGAMPEILTPRMLSRGNGILESLSFLAVILGTVVGGVLSTTYRGSEYMIGVILTILAVIGAGASLFIERIPAANQSRPFPPYIYGPLVQNLKQILTSRPLVFAVVGIAFFTFLVAFMRMVVYMHGQSQLPPWSESKTSEIVGVVALGIGIGSPLVGYLSGGKVEIGLVPIGALGMMLATSAAAVVLANVPLLIVCIGLIGFFTGFYLVPLFSLLQHRAPKTSKGDAIATSNFINITGAIASSLVFGGINMLAIQSGFVEPLEQIGSAYIGKMDAPPEMVEGQPHKLVIGGRTYVANPHGPKEFIMIRMDQKITEGDEVALRTYRLRNVTYWRVQPATAPAKPVYNKEKLPSLLFLGAGVLTLLTLLLLWYFQHDLFQRTAIWMRNRFRSPIEVAGMNRLPDRGPAILVTDVSETESLNQVISASDRTIYYLQWINKEENVEVLTGAGKSHLRRGEVVGLVLEGEMPSPILEQLLKDKGGPVLPVHHTIVLRGVQQTVYVVAGRLLEPGTTVEMIRNELVRVREDTARKNHTGEPLEQEEEH